MAKHILANEMRVMFKGKEYGTLQNVDCQISTAPETISGVGSPIAVENPPTLLSVSASASRAIFKGSSMAQDGLIPSSGGNILEGVEFDIESVSSSGEVVFKLMFCIFESVSISINKHTTVTSNVSFRGRNYSNLVV